MGYNNYLISKSQAKQLAAVFFPDIAEYIQTHQDEYERFLSSEMGGEK